MSGSGRPYHVQTVLELEAHVNRRLGLERHRLVGQKGGDLDLIRAEFDRRRLVTREDPAERGVANRTSRFPGGVVAVAELLGDHAALVRHVDAGERHPVEAAAGALLRITRRDQGVEDAELADDGRVGVGQQIVRHVVFVGERPELLRTVIAHTVDADSCLFEEPQVRLQLDQSAFDSTVTTPPSENTTMDFESPRSAW